MGVCFAPCPSGPPPARGPSGRLRIPPMYDRALTSLRGRSPPQPLGLTPALQLGADCRHVPRNGEQGSTGARLTAMRRSPWGRPRWAEVAFCSQPRNPLASYTETQLYSDIVSRVLPPAVDAAHAKSMPRARCGQVRCVHGSGGSARPRRRGWGSFLHHAPPASPPLCTHRSSLAMRS